MGADEQNLYFKLTVDHLHTINERAVKWMLIRRIHISSPHQTTHYLAMGEQQDGC